MRRNGSAKRKTVLTLIIDRKVKEISETLNQFLENGPEDRWVAYQERRLVVPHTDVEAPATPGIQDPCGIRKIISVPSLTGLG
jgi:hypothetical protein